MCPALFSRGFQTVFHSKPKSLKEVSTLVNSPRAGFCINFIDVYKRQDYTKVDEAIEKANVLNKDEYKDFTAVEEAVEAVERGMAKAIEDAIGALQYKDADYTKAVSYTHLDVYKRQIRRWTRR